MNQLTLSPLLRPEPAIEVTLKLAERADFASVLERPMGSWYPARDDGQSTISPTGADVMIVGASVRAAVASAARAGLSTLAVDLFADRDLLRFGPTCRWSGDWTDLPQLLAVAPARQWIYTGGLENFPDVIAQGARVLPLVGNDEPVIRRVRDPRWLARLFHAAQIPFPEVASGPVPLLRSTERFRWVRKEYRSAGGGGVRWATTTEAEWTESRPLRNWYLQPFVSGESQAGTFLAKEGSCELLGVTRQWVGLPWLAARPFQYCGSLGPLQLTQGVRAQWERIGTELARHARLSGLFGVDAILDQQGCLWPLEVNPRYTASMEVLERSWGFSAIAAHLATDETQLTTQPLRTPTTIPRGGSLTTQLGLDGGVPCVGKAIVFAPMQVTIHETLSDYLDRANAWSERPLYADLPNTGQTIGLGEPILTVLAEGDDATLVTQRLRRRVEWVYRYLHG